MKFREVAIAFDQIDKTSSRLSITKQLAELLNQASPQEAAIIAYLSLGNVGPSYIGTQFNFAEKSIQRVIASLVRVDIATIKTQAKKVGDLGLVFEQNNWKHSVEHEYTLLQVNRILHEFLKINGTGSQNVKEKKLSELFISLDSMSSKYVIRIIVGKLRLGFSQMTLLDAFSWMQTGDKSLRKELENAYNISADIGHIIRLLKEQEIKGIKNIQMIPGVPIRPAAAQRMVTANAIVKKLGQCAAQPKLDGFRLQVHKWVADDKSHIRFFSRNLQDMSAMLPELKTVVKNIKAKEFIAEGEAITYDPATETFLPFQETAKRRRKYDVEKMAKTHPLKLFFFDLLMYEGQSILEKTHMQRRTLLLKLVSQFFKKKSAIDIIEEVYIKTGDQLEEYFYHMIEHRLEGLVIKKLDAVYQPGKRNFNWVKFKRQETGQLDDTIDCVILGYYAGHGKRSSFGIGALLVGVYNTMSDQFETIAKIGTGMTDVQWRCIKQQCDDIMVAQKPKNIICSKKLIPDQWVLPELVSVIRADEISLSPTHSAGKTRNHSGYALRFPRHIKLREDKSARNATTVKEITQLYDLQFENKKPQKN